ncbi:MAG TPA: carboxypeptidase regulatory-like domain-containing protein, partial [Candidatus Acidoferrales bacterium]|nr:carboxypeptidase regulatory-like domain-containing protein [Candidatus Acidoferrales bacterium]
MRSTKVFFVLACLLGTLFLLAPAQVRAQTANVSGTVTDATGAAVPEVKATARNTQTSASRTAQTGDTGFYRITTLVPGVYEIVFEKDGFRTLRYSNVVLTVDQSLTLDVKLEISPIAQTVEVSGQSVAPIELDNAQLSNIVDARRVSELPLIVRNPYELVLLSPGTIVSSTRLGGFAVNGQSEKHNNFLLDGADNNDTDVPGIPGGITSLNPDATQEFRVITNSFSAEFGRNNGAIIDIVTKSGTNELRGVAYWFGRYAAQGARDFFNPSVDSNGNPQPKAPYVRNDFGASLGGPLIKNKTFWFGNYEGQRFRTTLINVSTVPTADFKSGLFIFRGQTVDVRTP